MQNTDLTLDALSYLSYHLPMIIPTMTTTVGPPVVGGSPVGGVPGKYDNAFIFTHFHKQQKRLTITRNK